MPKPSAPKSSSKAAAKPDPARLLKLLWRHHSPALPPRKGPRPALNVDQLLIAAIALADREGLEALTIRRLATELSTAAMSLYTYVADKAELLELMIDTVYTDMTLVPAADSSWPAGVQALATSNLKLYQQHPWLTEISSERPPLGPGVIGKYDRELSVFEGLGLSDIEMDAALSFVLNFVRAAARDQVQAERLAALTQANNLEWWQAQEAAFSSLLPIGRYPLAERVGSAAGEHHQGAYHSGFAYQFGLERVLAGLDQLISSKSRAD